MKLSKVNIKIKNEIHPFHFRENSLGDKGVMRQIFLNHDYDISHWEQGRRLIQYHEKNSHDNYSLIVDAGANIGASALFFSQNYKNSFIFSIEPDELNYRLLSLNCSTSNCFNFHGAISSEDGELLLFDPGNSDWGYRTIKTDTDVTINTKRVPSICPASILNHPSAMKTKPLIFKIDIEGAEEDLFSKDIEWMQEFPLVIIELHDWMLPFKGSSRNFLKAVSQYNFDFIHRGENIFLFNRDILG